MDVAGRFRRLDAGGAIGGGDHLPERHADDERGGEPDSEAGKNHLSHHSSVTQDACTNAIPITSEKRPLFFRVSWNLCLRRNS